MLSQMIPIVLREQHLEKNHIERTRVSVSCCFRKDHIAMEYPIQSSVHLSIDIMNVL